jgi:hypothetical protein
MFDGIGEVDGHLDGALFGNMSTNNVYLAVDVICICTCLLANCAREKAI